MLRIDVLSESQADLVVQAEGAIAGEDVALLAAKAKRWSVPGRRVELRLDRVEFIDEAGVALLQLWSSRGWEVRGGSLFVRTLLQGGAPAEAMDPPVHPGVTSDPQAG